MNMKTLLSVTILLLPSAGAVIELGTATTINEVGSGCSPGTYSSNRVADADASPTGVMFVWRTQDGASRCNNSLFANSTTTIFNTINTDSTALGFDHVAWVNDTTWVAGPSGGSVGRPNYVSHDDGVSWTVVPYGLTGGNFGAPRAGGIHLLNESTWSASIECSADNTARCIQRTTDAGASWNNKQCFGSGSPSFSEANMRYNADDTVSGLRHRSDIDVRVIQYQEGEWDGGAAGGCAANESIELVGGEEQEWRSKLDGGDFFFWAGSTHYVVKNNPVLGDSEIQITTGLSGTSRPVKTGDRCALASNGNITYRDSGGCKGTWVVDTTNPALTNSIAVFDGTGNLWVLELDDSADLYNTSVLAVVVDDSNQASEFDEGLKNFAENIGFKTSGSKFFFGLILMGIALVLIATVGTAMADIATRQFLGVAVSFTVAVMNMILGFWEFWEVTIMSVLGAAIVSIRLRGGALAIGQDLAGRFRREPEPQPEPVTFARLAEEPVTFAEIGDDDL